MKITAYLQIFEKKLNNKKERLRKELKKPKKARNKKLLKTLLRDIKQLKDCVKGQERDQYSLYLELKEKFEPSSKTKQKEK